MTFLISSMELSTSVTKLFFLFDLVFRLSKNFSQLLLLIILVLSKCRSTSFEYFIIRRNLPPSISFLNILVVFFSLEVHCKGRQNDSKC